MYLTRHLLAISSVFAIALSVTAQPSDKPLPETKVVLRVSRDFIHKLRIALKELNEARIWLRMIILSEMLSEFKLVELLVECEELCRILYASILTAQQSLATDRTTKS